MSDRQGRIRCFELICGLDSQDLAEVTRRSGTTAPRSRANWPMIARSPAIFPGQRKRTLRELLGVRNINGGRQCRHLADLIWSEGLRDFDNPGLTTLEIGDRDCAVAGAEVDSKTETSAHERVIPVVVLSIRAIAARDRKHRLYVIRLGRPAAGRCEPAYLSSTSAGAIAGSRSVELRKMRGKFTASVFQPWWTSTPENGAGPLILPSSRYSSGE